MLFRSVQEDSGRIVEVHPGFCIIATANEKSKRYKGVDDLSVEFQNRFGANINRVRYPDHDKSYGEYPRENAQLAMPSFISTPASSLMLKKSLKIFRSRAALSKVCVLAFKPKNISCRQ